MSYHDPHSARNRSNPHDNTNNYTEPSIHYPQPQRPVPFSPYSSQSQLPVNSSYQQPTTYEQPISYQQTNTYQQPTTYQQPNTYQQPSTFQQQYQQPQPVPYQQPPNYQNQQPNIYQPKLENPSINNYQKPQSVNTTQEVPQQQNFDYFGNINQQIGMQLGNQAFQQGEQMVKKNIDKYINIPQLKHYFNVSNSYVLYKIQVLLFPFRHKSWSRLVLRSEIDGQMEGYKPPREDLNAPDLYIPVMSFVTYVLFVGFHLGSGDKNTFTPDVLAVTSTTAIFIIVLEVALVKLGCYVLNISSQVPLLDLISYCGYQFIGLICTIAMKIISKGSYLYTYLVFAYTMTAFAFFLLRSLRHIIFPESSSASTPSTPTPRKAKINFLFFVLAIQIFFAYFLT